MNAKIYLVVRDNLAWALEYRLDNFLENLASNRAKGGVADSRRVGPDNDLGEGLGCAHWTFCGVGACLAGCIQPRHRRSLYQ